LAKILLVRHAQTKLHQDNRFWGKTDITLSDYGVWQAEKLRDRLVEENITAVYTSTLSRARHSAEIIASVHKCHLTTHEELDECNFGFIEGCTMEEIRQRYPELAEELLNWKTVSFPGGESLEDLDKRVRSFLDRLEDLDKRVHSFLDRLDKNRGKETVLIVSHGGPLRLLIGNLLGLKLEYWSRFRIEHASLSIVEAFEQGNILTLLNDTSHFKI